MKFACSFQGTHLPFTTPANSRANMHWAPEQLLNRLCGEVVSLNCCDERTSLVIQKNYMDSFYQ